MLRVGQGGEGPVQPAPAGRRGPGTARQLALRLGVISMAACVAGVAVVPGALAAPSPGSRATARAPAMKTTTSTVSSGGLSVTLTVAPTRAAPGAAIEFKVSVADRKATGALGYVLHFGDGASRANPIPLFCRAGPGSPTHETWRFVHHYARAGVYHASAYGFANCKPAHVTARASVAIS